MYLRFATMLLFVTPAVFAQAPGSGRTPLRFGQEERKSEGQSLCHYFKAFANDANPEILDRRPQHADKFVNPLRVNPKYIDPRKVDSAVVQVLSPFEFVNIQQICFKVDAANQRDNTVTVPIQYKVGINKPTSMNRNRVGLDFVVTTAIVIQKNPEDIIEVAPMRYWWNDVSRGANMLADIFAPQSGNVDSRLGIKDPRVYQEFGNDEEQMKDLNRTVIAPVLFYQILREPGVWAEVKDLVFGQVPLPR